MNPAVPTAVPRTPEEIFAVKLVTARLKGEDHARRLEKLRTVCDELREKGIAAVAWCLYYDSDENHFTGLEAWQADGTPCSDLPFAFEDALWGLIEDCDGDEGLGMFHLDTKTYTLLCKGTCWIPDPELVEEPYDAPVEVL